MFEKILGAALAHPKHLQGLSNILLRLSFWLGIAGILGFFVKTATGAMGSLVGRSGEAIALAEIYPLLPTAWIPESTAGFVVTGLIFLLGIWLRYASREIERLLRD